MLQIAYSSEKISREEEIKWILNRLKRNHDTHIQTCLVAVYHSIDPSDISDLLDNNLLYADIVQGSNRINLSEKTFQINNKLLDIGIFLSQLLTKTKDEKTSLEIIFYSFSALIHNLGDEDVYKCLTYKMPDFSGKNNLLLFMTPKSHSDHVWEKFIRLAREKIEI